MAAYTTPDRIAAYLGIALTPEQEARAAVLADAATAWIDHYTGRSWQSASPITDELSSIVGQNIYLGAAPVLSVESVGLRWRAADDPLITLDDGEWELIDPVHGVLLVPNAGAYPYALASVSYTHDATAPPADVALAADMIAGAWLTPSLIPASAGVQSISVGQNDINTTFRPTTEQTTVPGSVTILLAPYRRPVVA